MARKTVEVPLESFSTFGEFLRYLRERAHLSQRDLAAQAGYHYSYISYLEKNARVPDVATVKARFIPVLGLSYDEKEWIDRLLTLASQAQQPAPSAEPEESNRAYQWNVVSLTSIIGRERETRELVDSLSNESVRLVTLVGPPGVGKTRLAMHAAEIIKSNFDDGAVFVNLAPIDHEDAVLTVLSEALGVQEETVPSRQLVLQAFLQEKNLLIVLDNFEQVLPAARHLPHILKAAPRVKFLVTSREALRIPGEQEFQLQPFQVHAGGQAELSDDPAVKIFVERAGAVKSDFRLTEENASTIAEICRRLDGLPLALELAAARIGTLPPTAMLEQFDRRFQWLTRGRRDQPTWRQTLLGAVEWSYNLLSENERILFRRLSIFSGGWTLEAAEAVCSDESLSRADIYSLLLQLVDRSLVVIEETGTTRFRYLDTIHHFAAQKLEEHGERSTLRDRHLKYFAGWAGGFASRMEQSFPREIRTLVEADHNNVRAALDWGMESTTSGEDGMRLAVEMGKVWLRHSNFRDGLDRALAYLPLSDEHPHLKAELLYLAGAHSYWRELLSQAKAYCLASRDLAEKIEDRAPLLGALFYLGDILRELNEVHEAWSALERAVLVCRESGQEHRLSLCLTSLARVCYQLKNYPESKAALREAQEIAARTKNPWAECYALRVEADCLRFDGNYEEGLRTFERALQVSIQIDDRISMGISLANMSLLCNLLERYESSGQYAERAFRIFQAIGNEYQQPFPQRMMAYAALHAGDLQSARAHCMKSIRGNQLVGHHTGVLAGLLMLCKIELAQENIPQAYKIYEIVQSELKASGANLMEPDEKTRMRLQNIFADPAYPDLAAASETTPTFQSLLAEYNFQS